MSDPRTPQSIEMHGAWETTSASALDLLPFIRKRSHPPLREVLKGLDARELEGQTVFDHLFGDDEPHLAR